MASLPSPPGAGAGLPHLPGIRAVSDAEAKHRRKLAKGNGISPKRRRVPWRHLDLGTDYKDPVNNPRMAFPKLDVNTLAPDTAAEVENIWMLSVMDHEATTQDRLAASRDALLVRQAGCAAWCVCVCVCVCVCDCDKRLFPTQRGQRISTSRTSRTVSEKKRRDPACCGQRDVGAS